MNIKDYFAFLLVMALVTYLVRTVPFVVFRKKIKNRFFKSFLAFFTNSASLSGETLL